ncbi:MAG: glycosyltransferase family 2 protein [Candidatus Bathyarchaeota archaeon]|nr:glycosyltransferase family 2 protein [Candidatus Bathyarchaeota archaeon]
MVRQLNCSVLESSPYGHFVSVIVPAYKEEEYIADTLTDVVARLRETRFRFEVLVILDYVPDDRTGFIVHKLRERFSELRLIEGAGKHGVGNAIRTGIKMGKGSIFVLVMGDHSESSFDLVKLVNAIAQGYDVSVGDRFKYGKPKDYPPLKYVANRCCNYLIKWLFRTPFSDVTNAFKAYNAKILKQLDLSSNGFEIFLEIPIKIFLRTSNVKIINIPVQHFVRKKKVAKLSLLKEGPRYIKIVFSLFIRIRRMKKTTGNYGIQVDQSCIFSID